MRILFKLSLSFCVDENTVKLRVFPVLTRLENVGGKGVKPSTYCLVFWNFLNEEEVDFIEPLYLFM